MRVVFMGTPAFAVPTLRALIQRGDEVVTVICQPDKPKGRGRRVSMPPVKQLALEHGIECAQPQKVRGRTFRKWLADLHPEVAVVAAYGKILPPKVLATPRHGCINVHASLLPELRGAAPINWTLIRGYTQTGVTIIQMDEGMDTGDVLLQQTTPVGQRETAAELHDRLATMGAEALVQTLDLLETNRLAPQPQDDSKATYAPLMKKEDGQIDWSRPAREVFDLVRGVYPWPGAYTLLDGLPLKIFPCERLEEQIETAPGRIIEVGAQYIRVACGVGSIFVTEVQAQGRKRMPVKAFLCGHTLAVDQVLGE